MAKKRRTKPLPPDPANYEQALGGIVELLEAARRSSARAVNAFMTASYWEIGRRIVEFEQGAEARAEYGEQLIKQLSADLSGRFGRGFSKRNLEYMRRFYSTWPTAAAPTSIEDSVGYEITQTPSALSELRLAFPLPWSHYVELLSVRSPEARSFYEQEALRGGWSIRQLKRQVGSKFYERALLSKNKDAMLAKGLRTKPEDGVTPEEEIRDPLVLEFLDLKDEYSETDLEDALIHHLENFLLELGSGFTFVGRQRRLRVDDSWFRVDLVMYNRHLRALVLIDLKLTKFTPGDVGQMNLYLNYAKRHWTLEGENPPLGLILCAGKGRAAAEYAMEGLANEMHARDYLEHLPDTETLAEKLEEARKRFEEQHRLPNSPEDESS